MEKVRVVHPGPRDASLLCRQPIHVSEYIWNGEPDRVLRIRRAQGVRQRRIGGPPSQIRHLLSAAGFLGVAEMLYFQLDHPLISALVERWRPETHTFHMPVGECTVTLQDVSILLGLPVDGQPITGISSLSWVSLVENLLGIAPEPSDIRGGGLKLKWLDDHFADITIHESSEIQLQRFTRAYILRLFGGLLFPDHSGRYVHLKYLPFLKDFDVCGTLSWGSAVLSYLYRELCKATNYEAHEIGGACILLQLWAWERFPYIGTVNPPVPIVGSPLGARWIGGRQGANFSMHNWDITIYRDKFDNMKQSQIVWDPYSVHFGGLPQYCFQGAAIWRSVVPLIVYERIEWHQPDRVLRQFDMQQHIPGPPFQDDRLHDISLKGKESWDWSDVHRDFLHIWNERLNYVFTAELSNNPILASNSEYMVWYKKHTRRWIGRESAKKGYAVDTIEHLYHSSTEQHRSGFTHEEVRIGAGDCLEIFESIDRVTQPGQAAPPLTQQLPQLPQKETVGVGRREGRGLHRRRRHVEHDRIELPQPPPEPTEGTYYVTPSAPYDDFTPYSYMSQHDGSSQLAHLPHDCTPSCHGFHNVSHELSLSLGQRLSSMNQRQQRCGHCRGEGHKRNNCPHIHVEHGLISDDLDLNN